MRHNGLDTAKPNVLSSVFNGDSVLYEVGNDSLIIEEGFPLSDLSRIVASIQKAAEEAGVKVVTGDTQNFYIVPAYYVPASKL